MTLRQIPDLDLQAKRVLVRVDFNVPMSDGNIVDDTRIRAAIPTIQFLLDCGAIVTLVAHLGRPKGKVDDSLRMKDVANRLEALIEHPVTYVDEVIGSRVEQIVAQAAPGTLILLENVRFDEREEQSDSEFASLLARGQDVFVNDAFGAAHRAHASTVGVADFLPACAGFLMKNELDALERLTSTPERPFVAILGGAKVSDKIGVIENLIPKIDVLLLGGGMANTFLFASNHQIGKSLAEREFSEDTNRLIEDSRNAGVELELPLDVVMAPDLDGEPTVVSVDNVEDEQSIFDIGPATVEQFRQHILKARTIFWNGPMGVFERADFANGTLGVARAVADSDAFSVVGGGDSLAAIHKAGLENEISHLSTGGGASLEYVEGKSLPGVQVLSMER